MENFNKIMKSMTFDFFSNGKHKISVSNFLKNRDSILLDVRSKEEFNIIKFDLLNLNKVIDIPIDQIPDRLNEIPKDKMVGTFCSSGVRSSIVYYYLRGLGFENVKIIQGGYKEFVEELKPGKLLKLLKIEDKR